MIICQVLGTVVATQKDAGFRGSKLMLVQRRNDDGSLAGDIFVATDTVGAGTGEVVLVEDEGETVLRAGDCAGFKAGVMNGHHIQNRSTAEAVLLEIGSRLPGVDGGAYPDIDLVFTPDDLYRHRDGTPYDADEGRQR